MEKVLIAIIVVLVLFVLAQSGVCPPCYRFQPLLDGRHGPASSSDPRRKVIIANDVPGANNSKVNGAISGGSQKWNDARDNTSNPPNVYTTNYFFTPGSYDSADIIVKATAGSLGGAPANIDLTTYPHVISIRSDILNSLSAGDLAAIIAHELGHRIGLGNWDGEPDCPGVGATIMNGSNPLNGGRMHTTEVKANDVFQSNRSADPNTTANCVQPAPQTAAAPACTDTDGDGICSPDDCDDSYYDPSNMCQPVCNASYEGPVYFGGGDIDCYLCNDGIDNDCNGAADDLDGGCIPCLYYTPILVDVDGLGFSLTDAHNGVLFDFFGTGRPVRISWTSPNSTNAWLALDRNGNGAIDSGRELFGNVTPQPISIERNGFIALAEHDKPELGGNGDGEIMKTDGIFSSLLLWQDVNHNGISEPAELHTLQDLGLKSIHLDYKTSRRIDQYGNQFRYRGKVKDKHDAQLGRWAWDVILMKAP